MDKGEVVKLFCDVFSPPYSGAVRFCHCGKIYYNPDGGWDWNEGELEGYEKRPQSCGC